MLESLFNSEYWEIFKSTFFEEHLRTAASKILFTRIFNSTLKNRLFQLNFRKKWKWLFLFHGFFLMKFVFTYNISFVWWEIFLLELQIYCKRRSKVQEKNMSCQRALNFGQWKMLSENYKPMRVWLWLVYKFIENYCRLRLFSEFIQTQNRYPTSFDKIRILTWKILVLSS